RVFAHRITGGLFYSLAPTARPERQVLSEEVVRESRAPAVGGSIATRSPRAPARERFFRPGVLFPSNHGEIDVEAELQANARRPESGSARHLCRHGAQRRQPP